MTSTGVEKARSPEQRTADNTRDISKQIIEDTKVFNSTSPEFALGGEQGSSEGTAAGNYLAKSGDVRLGPMGNEFKILEILDDEISVSVATANYVPWIILNPESGSPDDLETIVPGESVFLNQELVLQGGNITNDITLKNSGNIITSDGGDLVLAFGEIIRLYYSQLLAAWVVAWASSGVGGGDVTFPIDFEEQVLTPVANEITIDFADPARHYPEVTVTADTLVNLINFPAGKTAHSTLDILQDSVGNHTLTFSPPLLNLTSVSSGPDTLTSVLIRRSHSRLIGFIEGENIDISAPVSDWANFAAVDDIDFATFDGINIDRLLFDQNAGSSLGASETGITSNGASELLHNVPAGANHIFTVNNVIPAALVISETTVAAQTLVPAGTDDLGLVLVPWNNVYANNAIIDSISGVSTLDFDGATANIVGLQLIDLFQTDQQIESLSTGIEYTAGDLQSHLFKSQTTDIAQFEEAAAGVFRLDMLDHSIKDARDVTLSNASGATIFAGTSPAIGFDSTTSTFVINFPAGAKIGISENNAIGSTEISEDGVISDIITADSDLFIGILGTSPPTVTGQFTNDATDVFVFSGGLARNMSSIGVVAGGANVNLSNLTATSVNDDIIPQAGKLLGSD